MNKLKYYVKNRFKLKEEIKLKKIACKVLLIISFIICAIGFYYPSSIIVKSKSMKEDSEIDSKEDKGKNTVKFKNIDNIDLSGITYFTSETNRDTRLEAAIVEAYKLEKSENKVRYYFNRVQLNNNIEPETFVYLIGPEFCGTGGCSAAIFTCESGQYKLLSKFTLVNNPVLITNNFTNGYRDIIMYVSGGGIKESYRIMKFNGSNYPENPSVQPKIESRTKLIGPAIISDDVTKNPGMEFKVNKYILDYN